MKCKVLLGGLKVGLFEEVYDREYVYKFFDCFNEVELQLFGEEDVWFYVKLFVVVGMVGYYFIWFCDDIDCKMMVKDFFCLVESYLSGKEFFCEVFIYKGKICFFNIIEYVKLGYFNFILVGFEFEVKWELIYNEVQKMVDIFGIEFGMVYLEWFVSDDGKIINFGEVVCWIFGGYILDFCG